MSSTGQIVGGIVGAVVGFYTGVGPVYGAQIGMMIGGAIDPPDGPVINGPRLDDLSIQTATYGAFIPRNYGTIAQTGNIFWLKGDALTETPRAEESGGKGGPTSTTNLWDYSATFALGLCDCSSGTPIDGIRRIWINGQLFYDAGSDDVATIIASNEAAEFFTLYNGSDTQMPDPLMQADKGIANVPAYRGLAYIVFENLPLAKYNNSLAGAQIKVEIVKDAVLSYAVELRSTVSTGGARYPRAIVTSGNYAFVCNYSGSSIQAFNIGNPEEMVSVGYSACSNFPVSIATDNIYLYVVSGSSTLQVFMIRYQFEPLLMFTTYTGYAPTCVVVDGNYIYVTCAGLLQIFEKNITTGPWQVSTISLGGNPNALKVIDGYAYIVNFGSNLLQIVDVSIPAIPTLVGSVSTSIQPYSLDVRDGYAYVLLNGLSLLEIYDVSNVAAPVFVSSVGVGASPTSITVEDDYAFVMCFSERRVRVYGIKNKSAISDLAFASTGSVSPYALAKQGSYIFVTNYGTGEVQSFLFRGEKIVGSSTTLGNIVQSECLTSKLLTAGDIDVTELTDTVRGYRIASLGALRGGIDPLRAAWPFDVVQHGYQIKFKRRGSASVATIDASELDARTAGEAPGVQITNSREMDTLLPSSLRLKYIDSVREYDTNEQISDRGL